MTTGTRWGTRQSLYERLKLEYEGSQFEDPFALGTRYGFEQQWERMQVLKDDTEIEGALAFQQVREPQALGGLPTPRIIAEQKGQKVISKSGKDVTKNFREGAKQVLELAKLFGVKEAILKQKHKFAPTMKEIRARERANMFEKGKVPQ